ncbi:ribokinase [Hoeflea prorocentri]|uniref:Ribokinase n=1 Tax=Hoeflea prorocentri TaxID=1922333 RepID=A0A9X3UK20_9HYPH|nr:ribokinase [Hoeflea prorocentri]MCY6382773.1 ribokinase [Hoeflea prorocentri]MDA5400573.1 ribokinase [Hoeflea prorocentri]
MITVLGSINMDLIATVDRLPRPGETVIGSTFATAAGGKGANQALAAQRAGSKTRMTGAVGDDQFAKASLGLLAQAGVDLTMVQTTDGPTGTAVILVEHDGENSIAVVPGANGHVSAADAQSALGDMDKGDYLLLQLEVPAEAVSTALAAAREQGVVSVLNIAPLTDDAVELATLADIVIANETEFERLAGRTDIEPALRETLLADLHAASGQTLIVTLGADGVIAAHDGALIRTQGLVIDPVDTVGAGDTFCGYLAAALDGGDDFETALKKAAAAGSLACLKHGAQPAIPFKQDVVAALEP